MKQNRYRESMKKVPFSEDFDQKTIAAMENAAPAKPKKRAWLRCGAAAAAVLVVVGAGMAFALSNKGQTPVPQTTPLQSALNDAPVVKSTTLLLSVNPQVEFEVDERDMILSVTGKNEDGAALIEGIDFTGYSFENAAVVVVNQLIKHNYITVNDVDRTITLSLSGEKKRASLINDMSVIIKAAAEPYSLEVDTVQTEKDALELVLASKPVQPDENDLPAADPEQLPVHMEIEFSLTGKINKPEDIGYQGTKDTQYPVFQHGASEVNDVMLTLEDGREYAASEIVDFDTAGDWLSTSTLQVMHSLITKGYIANDIGGKVVISLPDCTEQQLTDTKELISLILLEARLALAVEQTDDESLAIVPGPKVSSEILPAYSMAELLDIRYNKDLEQVTDLQMDILSRAFTYDGAMDKLAPRYWAVIPNLVGLTEEEAVALCEQIGFVPRVVHEELSWFESDARTHAERNLGKVIYQDGYAGVTMQVGMPLQINVVIPTQEAQPQKPEPPTFDQ